ncbi:MAG: hypothetical protein WBA51_13655 [Erythrobacter sp.]
MKKLVVISGALAFAAGFTQPAMAASCSANVTLNNTSNSEAVATVYSKTRLNAGWSPKRSVLSRDESRKLIAAVSGVAGGVATAATVGTAGAATPVLAWVGVGTVAAGAINEISYDVRDRRVIERTFVIKPRSSGRISVKFPFACRLKRQLLVDVVCKNGQQITYSKSNTKAFNYSKNRSYSRRICEGVR